MINLLSCPPVIVATLSGRSYYKITSTLKSLDLNFLSLSPQEAALSDAKIIITTLNESKIVKRNDVFLDTDLEYSPLSVKAKILQNFMRSYCYACDDVIVGVDPGKRVQLDPATLQPLNVQIQRYPWRSSSAIGLGTLLIVLSQTCPTMAPSRTATQARHASVVSSRRIHLAQRFTNMS